MRTQLHPRTPAILLLLVLALSGTATTLAMRRTSTTFDEIIMVAGGARGYGTGAWDLAPEHPPLVQYIYGLPVHLGGVTLPDESATPAAQQADRGYRTDYARQLYWQVGNDPERVSFLGRLPAVLMALGLVLATFLLARTALGPWPALAAATLVAFLPDVLAHGGVAYNDVPLALAYLLGVYALDAAVRTPTPGRGAVAGLAGALALGIKFSAVLLGPAALALVALEGWRRRGEAAWWRALAVAVGAGLVALYVGLVLIYRGDPALAEFRYGLDFTFGHVTEGHGAASYILGRTSTTGWWWFYPVAFLYKTPAALHLLLGVAALGFGLSWQARHQATSPGHSPLRAPIVACAVFAVALVGASLAIGFRYALPALPPLCILAAAGAARAWRARGRAMGVLVTFLVLAHAATSLSWYPWYLSFVSAYAPGRDQGHRVLVDSSLDWGQGLLALREELAERGIERVFLSYFGSALPWGYGLDYVPLPSYFPLEAPPDSSSAPGAEPTWAVVSATLLHPVYMDGSLFEQFKRREPDAVVARTLFLYRLR